MASRDRRALLAEVRRLQKQEAEAERRGAEKGYDEGRSDLIMETLREFLPGGLPVGTSGFVPADRPPPPNPYRALSGGAA